jgi:SAM-dependent methyltransferase
MASLVQTLKRSPFARPLQPGFPDGARLLAQGPALRRLAAQARFAGRCLNAGSGEGLYCGFLEGFPELTEIMNADLREPVEILRRPDPRHRVAAASLTELPFADASFDCALCTEVIEHIPDHDAAVRELHRVLRPGAPLLLSVPQNPAPPDPNHARQGYDKPEMAALLGRNGFEVVAMADCLHGLTRWFMHYWRRPWFRLRNGCPYLPQFAVGGLAWLDAALKPGPPWDLAVLARRRAA